MQDLGGLLSSSCTDESHGHGTIKDSYLSDPRHQHHCLSSLAPLHDRGGHKPCCSPGGSRVVDIQLCFFCMLPRSPVFLLGCLAKVSSREGGGGVEEEAYFFLVRTKLETGRAAACNRLVGAVALFRENCAHS